MEEQLGRNRSQEEAERRAESPNFYSNAFYVPANARWEAIRDDLHHNVGWLVLDQIMQCRLIGETCWQCELPLIPIVHPDR